MQFISPNCLLFCCLTLSGPRALIGVNIKIFAKRCLRRCRDQIYNIIGGSPARAVAETSGNIIKSRKGARGMIF